MLGLFGLYLDDFSRDIYDVIGIPPALPYHLNLAG
jgi:hypothetical protein